jgi:hypothetical protein
MKAVMLVLAVTLTPWVALAQGRFTVGNTKARILWTGSAVLQTSSTLVPGTWQDMWDTTNPCAVEAVNGQRCFRLRRPIGAQR